MPHHTTPQKNIPHWFSIIDLSQLEHTPFSSADGNMQVTHQEIKTFLNQLVYTGSGRSLLAVLGTQHGMQKNGEKAEKLQLTPEMLENAWETLNAHKANKKDIELEDVVFYALANSAAYNSLARQNIDATIDKAQIHTWEQTAKKQALKWTDVMYLENSDDNNKHKKLYSDMPKTESDAYLHLFGMLRDDDAKGNIIDAPEAKKLRNIIEKQAFPEIKNLKDHLLCDNKTNEAGIPTFNFVTDYVDIESASSFVCSMAACSDAASVSTPAK